MKLSELITVKKGKKPPVTVETQGPGQLPLLFTAQLRGVVPEQFCGDFQGQVLAAPQDVLISWDGTIGVSACGLTGVVGSTLALLKIKDSELVDTRYLWNFLRTKESEIQANPRGSSIPHINPDLLLNLDVFLPPLSKQLEISNTLEEVDTLIARQEKELSHLRGIEQNLFDSKFLSQKWSSSIGEIAEVQIGPFGSLLHANDYISGGVPVLNPTHIKGSKVVPNGELSVDEELAESLAKYRVRENDVILGRRGEMGRAGVITQALEGSLCGTGSVIVRPRTARAIWLRALLSSTRMKQFLQENSIGSTLPNLNASIVLRAPAPTTSIEDQIAFEEQVSALEDQISLVNLSIGHSKELFQSLLGGARIGQSS